MKNNWVLLSSSAEKTLSNSTVRGVRMLLSLKAYKSLNFVEIISPRIMIASFNGNPASPSYPVTVLLTSQMRKIKINSTLT